MTTLSKTISVLLLVVALMPSNAEAHAPRAREAVVIIQAINHDTRTLTLNLQQGRGQREFIWHSDTTFLHDWKVVPAAELKEGMRVTVYYHSPFFGKPFVTIVIWNNQRQPG